MGIYTEYVFNIGRHESSLVFKEHNAEKSAYSDSKLLYSQ